MAAPNTITMTMRELDKLKIIQAVVDGMFQPGKAAERLELSRRQMNVWWRGIALKVRQV